MAQNITRSIKKAEMQAKWVLIDATDVRLGKLATKVTALLMGKQKVNNADYLIMGDKVVVINALKISYHQTKLINKSYPRHSGFPGGFKQVKFKDLILSNPEYIIRQAVWGMLIKNKKGRRLLTNLYVFNGPEHKFGAQNPIKVELKN